jgi:pimeloyl-ACP methyl ester carboxylesterase
MSDLQVMRTLEKRARQMTMRFRSRFRQQLQDPNLPLSMDLDRDSSTLLVAFGGINSMLGVPIFEFFKSTGGIDVKRLFVRDLRQAWYHCGIPGHGDTVEEVSASLSELAARHGVRRLVVAGNSAGGYAAMLFGTLLGADVVLGFAPQTVIDLDVLAEMDDHRWDEPLRGLAAAGALDSRWTDLATALPAARIADTRYELYFDDSFPPDRLHAERMADLAGTSLHRHDGGSHSIAMEMRASGELRSALQSAVRPEAGARASEVS